MDMEKLPIAWIWYFQKTIGNNSKKLTTMLVYGYQFEQTINPICLKQNRESVDERITYHIKCIGAASSISVKKKESLINGKEELHTY